MSVPSSVIENGNDTTTANIKRLINITNSKSEILHIEAPFLRYDFDVEKRWGDSSKLYKFTNFRPKIDLIDGLNNIYSNINL